MQYIRNNVCMNLAFDTYININIHNTTWKWKEKMSDLSSKVVFELYYHYLVKKTKWCIALCVQSWYDHLFILNEQ